MRARNALTAAGALGAALARRRSRAQRRSAGRRYSAGRHAPDSASSKPGSPRRRLVIGATRTVPVDSDGGGCLGFCLPGVTDDAALRAGHRLLLNFVLIAGGMLPPAYRPPARKLVVGLMTLFSFSPVWWPGHRWTKRSRSLWAALSPRFLRCCLVHRAPGRGTRHRQQETKRPAASLRTG